MTRVYVDMVADLFHYGHMEFLRKARELVENNTTAVSQVDSAFPGFAREWHRSIQLTNGHIVHNMHA